MIALIALLTSVAAITGILAIGSGRHWEFEFTDYFRGKRNAILYLWVIISTIFSICHSGVIVDYGISMNWTVPDPSTIKWMLIHGFTGILLTCAHLFVATTLRKEVGPVNKYLWGKNRVVS